MSNPYFRFKQFTVFHNHCAMKVGTDGVLLGSWVNTSGCRKLLDVGSGSGLIALMLAQRSQAQINAIEIEENAFRQSLENINHSPWKDRITVYHTSFIHYQQITQEKQYDLIASNPPYFSSSQLPPSPKRQFARHSDNSLPPDMLIACARKMLSENGKIALILPASENLLLKKILIENNLFICRRTWVRTLHHLPPKRMLIEAGKIPEPMEENELTIEMKPYVYSEEFKALIKDFYLDFA